MKEKEGIKAKKGNFLFFFLKNPNRQGAIQ
jgi:hypothetical protein